MDTIEVQREIAEQYGSAFVPPRPDDIVGVAFGSLDHLPLNALRHPAEGSTCGWYIWGGELSQDPAFFESLHAAHLPQYTPELVQFLALEPGWRVLLLKGRTDVWYDPELLNV
jgi:hypothetical protein